MRSYFKINNGVFEAELSVLENAIFVTSRDMNAILALEDGTIFKGRSFGAGGERMGEVVFNTSMTGYQEIMTDPSYKGQIVTMTYPLIGNYGTNGEDAESRMSFVEGFVVRECSKIASNWRSGETLADYMRERNIIGIEGIDTRALTLKIRELGAMKAVLSTIDDNEESLIRKAKESPGLVGIDLVKDASCDKPYTWSDKGRFRVIVVDCGLKYNILRSLAGNGCKVKAVPAFSSAKDILDLKPDGVIFSNGPGDPAAAPYVAKTFSELIGHTPIFGICLGHQMFGMAVGGKTYKLKFGHHGANHPVKDLKTQKVSITSQNHGFCVDMDTLNKKDIEMTHVNLNDGTLEGMRHRRFPVFSVQFHPEASPGPHDSGYLFENFIEMMKDAKKKRH